MAAQLGIQVINLGGQINAGSTELITVLLTDNSGVYVSDVPLGTPQPVGTPGTVTVTLTTPSGQAPVLAAAMTASTTTTGYFNYTYTLPTTAERGAWRASFTATNGAGATLVSPTRIIFEVVSYAD